MSAIAVVIPRPVDVARLLVILGLMAAFVSVFAADIRRDCRKGAFSAGFSRGFDVGNCDLVVRALGAEMRSRVD